MPNRRRPQGDRTIRKRMAKNVYAKTREECERKLAELIKTMKAEIEELKKTTNKG